LRLQKEFHHREFINARTTAPTLSSPADSIFLSFSICFVASNNARVPSSKSSVGAVTARPLKAFATACLAETLPASVPSRTYVCPNGSY